MTITDAARTYLTDLKAVIDRFDLAAFESLVSAILDAYENERTIFTMGNGGSAATASHLVCDINKGCCMDLGKKFKMMCLSDNVATMMAYANDVSYEAIFIEPLQNFFRPGDLVIGFSGSGNSENVLRAIRWAGENGGITAGISGFDGGKLAGMVDIPLVADIHDMQKVEDIHVIACHMLMQIVYARLHPGQTAGAC
jgi:D-sedoheptulose 7-phosphate isomerase